MDESLSSPSPLSEGAGFLVRAGARIIDTLYGVFLGFGGGVVAGIALALLQAAGSIQPGWQRHLQGQDPLALVLSLVGGLFYHSFAEGIYGASLGKVICQLRVVSEAGGPCTFKSAFIRSLAYFVDALFFGLIAYSSMKKSHLNQRYGDHWGHTVVVQKSQMPPGAARPVSLAFGGIIAGSVCWSLLLAVSLILHVVRQG